MVVTAPSGYSFVSLIAQGAASFVFLARRADEIGGAVGAPEFVCKRLGSRVVQEPAAREAMAREGLLLGALAGRGAPRLIEAGEDQGGPFVVMERVSLPTLASGRGEGLARVAFHALATVHEAADAEGPLQIVHADLSPTNVLASEERACLVDFGLSAYRAAPHVHSTAFAGTLRYAAPEQARGEAMGQSADVFSLALCVLDALAGVSRETGAQALMLTQAAEGDPTELLSRAKGKLSDETLARLASCLAMDPAARPSARAVFP